MLRSITATTLLLATNAYSASVTYFLPSVFNSDTTVMDAELGILGYTIEDFEDPTLIDGLSIEQEFRNGPSSIIFSGTLPQTQAPYFNSTAWDGNGVLSNTAGNTGPFNSARSQTITFNFNSTLSVGIGLQGFQSAGSTDNPVTNHLLFINGSQIGVSLESLIPNFYGDRDERNGYLRIDAQAGELISSISFQNIELTDSNEEDYLEFDHFAVYSPVPLPSSIWLFFTAIAGLFKLHRAKHATSSII